MDKPLTGFTAYDVRGRVPAELDAEIAGRIGTAFVDQFGLGKVVIGRDMRLSSPEISIALADALSAEGADVLDIGLAGTEEVYHAVFAGEADGVDGGIMVTASHNPADYNGIKLLQRGARPVSSDSGLSEISAKASSQAWYSDKKAQQPGKQQGVCEVNTDKDNYIKFLLSFVEPDRFAPLKLVVNGGNGCAGPVIDLLEHHLPFTFIKLNHEPDGTFPNGVPNPLLPEKREVTTQAVIYQ